MRWLPSKDGAPPPCESRQPIRCPWKAGLHQRTDIQDVRAVCLALGPYRNLTTLTASVIALHPNCQVLNHGWSRVAGKGKLNFLTDYDASKTQGISANIAISTTSCN